jgi:hypothetical protein
MYKGEYQKKPSFLDDTKIRFLVMRKKLSNSCQAYYKRTQKLFEKLEKICLIYAIDDSNIDI